MMWMSLKKMILTAGKSVMTLTLSCRVLLACSVTSFFPMLHAHLFTVTMLTPSTYANYKGCTVSTALRT